MKFEIIYCGSWFLCSANFFIPTVQGSRCSWVSAFREDPSSPTYKKSEINTQSKILFGRLKKWRGKFLVLFAKLSTKPTPLRQRPFIQVMSTINTYVTFQAHTHTRENLYPHTLLYFRSRQESSCSDFPSPDSNPPSYDGACRGRSRYNSGIEENTALLVDVTSSHRS